MTNAPSNLKLEQIPLSLRSTPQWVTWRYITRDGKKTKAPVSPHDGSLADSTSPKTWGTFDDAVEACQGDSSLAGVGFVFTADDPYCGVDLDNSIDADGSAEITNVKDLTVSLEKAEADASTRANNGWRATVGTLKDASIEFTVLNKEGDSAFGLLQGLWSSGDPCDVGISDAGGTLTLTCEVMNFNVNQNLEEVISADVTLKPTQSSSGGGMNVGPGLAGP